jgi:hypothetical protein
MAAVTRVGLYGGPRAPYVVSGVPSAVVSASTITEVQVVAGGQTIVIDLVNDTWVASGATFNAQRQNIIDGLDSAEAEAAGWNVEVRDKELTTAVVRTSDTKVTITLTAHADYAITANETVTVTIPATALTAAGEITATPTVSVTNTSDDDRWELTRGITQNLYSNIVRNIAA